MSRRQETARKVPPGLKVTSVNFLEAENSKVHNTDEYDTDALIVRRGTPFFLEINYAGCETDADKFSLELATGKKPRRWNGSLIELVKKDGSKHDNNFEVISSSCQTIRVKVNLPADTLVACYTLSVVERKGRAQGRTKFDVPKAVYVLFNPWCKDDEVYMADEELKKEYVLNESGWIYWGGQKPKRWNFSQFSDAALKSTFKLLETAKMSDREKATGVVRYLSGMCNNCDGDGLLEGNWSGDYSGGVQPWIWSGSAAIFKKFLDTGKPVKYGQCWVFSGLTTSMMRCLGIATRSVTNYDSAHDTDNNCTFDRYFDEDYNYLDYRSSDSCWNFHVWNDVWMARPDLPTGMGGWQAIDGTPQEESDGLYQCGPSSLQCIKEGHVTQNFDTKFLFAEVNADTVYWVRNPPNHDEEFSVIRVKKNSVGSAVLTKAPNRFAKEDVIDQYKYKDGSMMERAAVRRALRLVDNPIAKEKIQDVTFSSVLPWNVTSEKPIVVKIDAKNTVPKDFTVATAVTAQVIRYNGLKIKTLPTKQKEGQLASKNGTSHTFEFDASDFVEHLDENISLRFHMVSKVKETGQVYVSDKITNVHKSEMTIENLDGKSSYKVGEMLKVKITIPSIYGLDNYTGCSLEVDCPVVEDITMPLGTLKADGSAVIEKSFKIKNVKKMKESELVATFNSNEITGINGTLALKVSPCC